MGYNLLIASLIEKTFNLLQDLAKDAILTTRSENGFDFVNKTSTSISSNTATKVVFVDKPSKSPENKNSIENVIVKAKGIDISSFDSLVIDGVNWNITKVTSSNRNVAFIEISKA